ncbi:hypothetical protein VTO73DRAFT_10158 [Trametes versicolor]
MSDFFNNNSSSTGNSEFTSGPGGGTQTDGFAQGQGQGGAYDNMQSSNASSNMGGGQGAMGSGVAGGYSGNQSSNTSSQTGEKKDWLDKGLESLGKKAGFNLSDKNADTAGDFLNKEVKERAGRNLPGVQ